MTRKSIALVRWPRPEKAGVFIFTEWLCAMPTYELARHCSVSYADRTTVIIQSEFGRRLYENNSAGTDHGNGNMMLALGRNVNGGKIYGDWPGLYPGTGDGWVDYANPGNGSTEPKLFQGALSVTTDFRRVLSEYLHTRGQHTTQSREFVFPGYTGYAPMGIFKPLPEPDDMIMSDGFE